MVLFQQQTKCIELSKSPGAKRFSMTFPDAPVTPLETTATPLATVRTVILRRCLPGPAAWGFSIAGSCQSADEALLTGAPATVVMVTGVTPESPACRAGLMRSDRLLCVNGKDLSQATHEEAVEAFRTAQEPIIVQVSRQRPVTSAAPAGFAGADGLLPLRIPPPPTKPLPAPPSETTTAVTAGSGDEFLTQTAAKEDAGKQQPLHRRLRCLMSAPLPESNRQRQNLQHLAKPGFRQPLCLSSSSQDLITGDAIEQLYQLADVEESLDYEEVTIQRSPSYSRKLGLTLCYSRRQQSEGPAVSSVFVDSIEPGSAAAAASPSIQPGDRILRVNGQRVLSREQTVRLFTESGRTVSLLMARSRRNLASISSPSSDDIQFNDNYALYDVATIVELEAAMPATASQKKPSRGYVPRMGTRDLPPAPKPQQQQRQQLLQHTQPQKVSAACQTACFAQIDPTAATTEWVVKRRYDGSRYVTRRPAKARLRRAAGHLRQSTQPLIVVEDEHGNESVGDQGDGSGDSEERDVGVEISDYKQQSRRTRTKQRLSNLQHSELVPVAIV